MIATFKHIFTPRASNNRHPRIIHPEGLLALSILTIAFQFVFKFATLHTSLGKVLGYSSSITSSKVIEQINAQRSESGLTPLTVNAQLEQAAIEKGKDMMEKGYWAHISPEGKDPWQFIQAQEYTYTSAGENLAKDFAETDAMIRAWMNSPTHRANILDTRFTETGIAVIDGQLEGVETTLVVQMFAHPSSKQENVVQQPALIQATQTTEPSELSPELFLLSTSNAQQYLRNHPTPSPSVMSAQVVAVENANAAYLSPLQISKAVFLAVIMLLILVLLYDAYLERKYHTIRNVGKNIAHVSFLLFVGILIVILKGGTLL